MSLDFLHWIFILLDILGFGGWIICAITKAMEISIAKHRVNEEWEMYHWDFCRKHGIDPQETDESGME